MSAYYVQGQEILWSRDMRLPILKIPYESGYMDTWQTQTGETWLISGMDTKHLFNSFLMLWNHLVDEQYQVWFNHKYVQVLNEAVMIEKINQIYKELRTRTDIGYRSCEVLRRIEEWNGLGARIKYETLKKIYEK